MANVNVNVTTKCEECGALTDESFTFGFRLRYFCPKHEGSSLHKSNRKAAETHHLGREEMTSQLLIS